MALLVFLVLSSICLLLFSFDKITFHFGMLVGLVVLTYFGFQQLRFKGKIRFFPKEPVIAIVYSLGIWGEPLLMYKGSFSYDLYFSLVVYALMVLMNVQLCSILQFKDDKESGYPSLAGAFGADYVNKLNTAIGILVAFLCIIVIFWPELESIREAAVIFLIMDFSLIFLNIISNYSRRRELIGILNDAIFFLPFLILLAGR